MFARSCGVLLHPTSLPGEHGIGELGAEARSWVDFLASAGQRLWQVMPLGPTGYGDSPYQCFSAFAGNPYLIAMAPLVEHGWLDHEDLAPLRELPNDRVDYGAVYRHKLSLLATAADAFLAGQGDGRAELRAGQGGAEVGAGEGAVPRPQRPHGHEDYASFCLAEADWLDDYALFMALKDDLGGSAWTGWPPPLRDRVEPALGEAAARLQREAARHKVWQYWFASQWEELKSYAAERAVKVIGDMPIFVALDSADVWANRRLFQLADDGQPTVVAGVPPDYFSATGQRWGNPLYRWDEMQRHGFAWWTRRMRAALDQVDIVRIDHFRGFAAYWEIPAAEPTAVKGRWVQAPGAQLFETLRSELGALLPVIAEDLGVITPDVEELRDRFGLPGMKVLQFAFAGGPQDPYLPHNYVSNCVVYTGTHDNDTTLGWYAGAPEAERDHVRRYLARDDDDIVWQLIRLAMASTADLAIVPLQDLLRLGSQARMNTPGSAAGNWSWRFAWEDVPYWLAPQLAELTRLYGRAPSSGPVDTAYRQSST